MCEEDFIIPNNLSAMAKTFYVKTPKSLKQDNRYIKPGSMVTGVKVIAQGEKIREVQRLINENPLPNGELTKPEDWYKVRGTAVITDGTDTFINCEIHWYQCENIGKLDFKIKKWGDKIENQIHWRKND